MKIIKRLYLAWKTEVASIEHQRLCQKMWTACKAGEIGKLALTILDLERVSKYKQWRKYHIAYIRACK